MRDPNHDDISLGDCISEGQLFYNPVHKQEFEQSLAALCHERRHVLLATDDEVCRERYYRYLVTRVASHPDLVFHAIELSRLSEWLGQRRNEIRESKESDSNRIIVMIKEARSGAADAWAEQTESLAELTLLNTQFLLAGSSAIQTICEKALGVDTQTSFCWAITPPTAEQLQQLLEIGQRFNYRSETEMLVQAYEQRYSLCSTRILSAI